MITRRRCTDARWQRHYQLLLQLSLLPNHDWRDKLAAFRSLHMTTVANGGVRAPTEPPAATCSAQPWDHAHCAHAASCS